MKKILFITSLLFIFNYAKPQSIQQDLTATQNNNISALRLDRYVNVSYIANSIQSKVDVVFDVNGNQTLSIIYDWNTDTQSFDLSIKTESTYDANGNQTLSIAYYWDSNTQSFVPYDKTELTYDANGNNTLFISYSWNTTSQSFVLIFKTESTYDANGNRTLSINYDWNTDTQSFDLSYKSEYSYDANGNQTLGISYNWNTDTQSFEPSRKSELTYDVNGNQTLGISYDWDSNTQSFVPFFKYESAYDVNGNQTLFIYYNWNTTSQSFVPLSKEVRTYNNGLPTTFLNQRMVYEWYSDLGIYKPSFKTEYSTILDTNTQLHRKGVLYQYDTNFNVWNALLGDEYNSYEYYTKTALSTETIDNNLISLYPNPTSNLLYVSHPELNSLEIQIKDLNGKQMYSGTMQKEVPLDVSSYAQGMYLITIENKETNKKKTYKIIKK